MESIVWPSIGNFILSGLTVSKEILKFFQFLLKSLLIWVLGSSSYICIIYVCIYICIYIFFYFILIYFILFINNYYQYRRSPNLFLKKCFTRNCGSIVFFFWSFDFCWGIWNRFMGFFFGYLWAFYFSYFLYRLFLSIQVLLRLRSSALMDDASSCIYIICARFSYLLFICSCIRIFLYSSIVCFALVINISIYYLNLYRSMYREVHNGANFIACIINR